MNPPELARAVHLAEQARNPIHVSSALTSQISAALTIGDMTGAHRLVERQTTLAESLGLPVLQVVAAQTRAAYHMAEGDLPALERDADTVLSFSEEVPSALAAYGGCFFELRWAQGRLGEFAAMFSDAAGELRSYAGFRPALVMAFLEAGDPDQARSVFADDAFDRFEAFPRDAIWLSCMALFGDAAVALGGP